MKFVALWSLKEYVDQEDLAVVMARRAEHEFPKGMKVIGEYWSAQGSPAVISIFECDDASALMLNSVAWLDALDVEIFPVVEWEEGLKKISEHLGGE
ncbi:MAG: DUF3303 domain-containing protein [Anaerolineae bacterium]|nr:DUF3303 domain-containing protein [Anaerolineae bacterium]NIN96697.1 DUF3303 domain-containing protein [Anaerolineae bacterium]NIQ79708.1 DUF3303 domain-containing protein [Anaerolineae bacterium]